jgi:hypothetical protein
MKYLRVRNFDKFQHYSKRNPPWIKFYASLLDDDDLERLPEIAQLHLFKMWLLASRKQNAIPVDSTWIAKKIGATSPVDIELLVSSGYCELYDTNDTTLAHDASTLLAHDATPETETEAYSETETETDSVSGMIVHKPQRGFPYNPNPMFGGALPPSLNTADFQAAWSDWVAHLKEKKNEMTTLQARDALAECVRVGPQKSIEMIRNSIRSGSKGTLWQAKSDKPAEASTKVSEFLAKRGASK